MKPIFYLSSLLSLLFYTQSSLAVVEPPTDSLSIQQVILGSIGIIIGLFILIFLLVKLQKYIDARVAEKLKAESHARYLARMGELPGQKQEKGKASPVVVELHDESMRKKIERIRLEKLEKRATKP